MELDFGLIGADPGDAPEVDLAVELPCLVGKDDIGLGDRGVPRVDVALGGDPEQRREAIGV